MRQVGIHRLFAVLILFGGACLLAGCGIPFLPSVPNDAPLALTVRDDEVWLHWCGRPTESYEYLSISFARYSPSRTDEAAVEGEGYFFLSEGDEFSTKTPPPGVTYSVSRSIPITVDRTIVFVSTGEAYDNLNGLLVNFDTTAMTSLADGKWLHPNGAITDDPCSASDKK